MRVYDVNKNQLKDFHVLVFSGDEIVVVGAAKWSTCSPLKPLCIRYLHSVFVRPRRWFADTLVASWPQRRQSVDRRHLNHGPNELRKDYIGRKSIHTLGFHSRKKSKLGQPWIVTRFTRKRSHQGRSWALRWRSTSSPISRPQVHVPSELYANVGHNFSLPLLFLCFQTRKLQAIVTLPRSYIASVQQNFMQIFNVSIPVRTLGDVLCFLFTSLPQII